MAAWKHGLRASNVTDADVVRYRLGKTDPELPDLLDLFVRAVGGDLSAPDLALAVGLASKAMVRQWMVEKIFERRVEIEDVLKDRDGNEIGRRVRANPLLKALKRVDHQLDLTVDHLRLSRRSRGQDAGDDAVAVAIRRARLRAAEKARGSADGL
ncbi:MAG TPA: hypothetical protein VLS25_01370 [Dehalococcoidia bacterium]|nr:hypothetical protein [Dehalococcoidia bacterium]